MTAPAPTPAEEEPITLGSDRRDLLRRRLEEARRLARQRPQPRDDGVEPPSPKRRRASPAAGAASPEELPEEEWTEADGLALQDAVTGRLQALCGERADVNVLAEFVAVMVGERKTVAEMSAELEPLFRSEAESFVAFVEGRRLAILAKRAEARGTSKLRAQLQPADEQEERGSSVDSARLAPHRDGAERAPVIVTDKLVLAPNEDHEGDIVVSHADKKNQLLAAMTKQLQAILVRLSDKSTPLDDEAQERLQAMAHSIQNQMTSLSKPRPS